jgi:hypothetical protein
VFGVDDMGLGLLASLSRSASSGMRQAYIDSRHRSITLRAGLGAHQF